MHLANCSMYNNHMPTDSHEIRVCNSCGLRYPLVGTDAHRFGIRCPACMGETRVALSRMLVVEATRDHPDSFHREDTTGARNSWKEERGKSLAVLLDNIRSAWNVGSILRSADGFGFAQAYLCGITPTPDGPGREAVKKTALGAQDAVAWTYHKDAVTLVKSLKQKGWRILALEDDERALPLESDRLPSRMREQAPGLQILIVGNEVTGVDPELLDLCDTIHCIPMRGQKRSFNVAIAFGIAAYALR